jgi:hypothetical protein
VLGATSASNPQQPHCPALEYKCKEMVWLLYVCIKRNEPSASPTTYSYEKAAWSRSQFQFLSPHLAWIASVHAKSSRRQRI